MRTRRIASVLAAAALLALTGSQAALAGERPGREPVRDAGRPHEAQCDRLAEKIAKLERAKEKLTALIARIEEKIASGELGQEQLARARAFLAKLQQRLAKLEEKLARLKQKQAERCGDSSPGTVTDAPTT